MEKSYSVTTKDIIALCHIIDDFKEFEKRLLPVISPKFNRSFVYQLHDISMGKSKLWAMKAKKFYSENKEIIDTINKYSDITRFICENYGYHGKPNEDLQFLYKYISNHKEKIEQILVLLKKLEKLDFYGFKFSEELDFTKEEYDAYPSFKNNSWIIHVANAQVIPSYCYYSAI